jgi:hypothetical protein
MAKAGLIKKAAAHAAGVHRIDRRLRGAGGAQARIQGMAAIRIAQWSFLLLDVAHL